MSFAQAVFNMTNALKPTRLKTMSQPVRFRKNDKDFVLYGEVITRMGRALAAKGFYKANATDKPVFTEEMSRALAQFQSRNKLPATGEPDQFTLFRLFN
jgi:peptidoglycan hydrolase-like protein with peptidoglycan-binding domain